MLHENIIVHYDVVGDLEDFDNSVSHGNSKGTEVFRPTMHSVKKNVKRFCLLPQNHRGLKWMILKQNKMHLAVKLMLLFPAMLVKFVTLKLIFLIESLLEQLKDAKNIRSPVNPHHSFLPEFCLQSGGQLNLCYFLTKH